MAPEIGPVEVTPYEPPPPNPFENMTDEQVEALLSGEPPPSEEPAAEPEPVPVERDPEPAAEPVPELEAAAAPAVTEQKEEVGASSVEDRLEDLSRQLELERLERQKAAAELERTKFLASRNAGKAGYLEKMLAERKGIEGDGGYADQSTVADDHPAIQEMRKEIGALKSDRVANAIAEAGAAFKQAHPDADKYQAEMSKILSEMSSDDVQSALYSDDPKLARITAKSVLESAYAEARIQALRRAQDDAKTRMTKHAETMRAQKSVASPPGVQRAPAPEKAQAPKQIEHMTDAEVDAMLDARLRRGR